MLWIFSAISGILAVVFACIGLATKEKAFLIPMWLFNILCYALMLADVKL